MNSFELDVTWKRAARVWLSFFWRHFIALIFVIIISGVIGGICGFIMAHLGFQKSTVEWFCGTLGFVIGIISAIIPLKMIIGKDFGNFRLVLLSKNDTDDLK